jgi:hypothetical protein
MIYGFFPEASVKQIQTLACIYLTEAYFLWSVTDGKYSLNVKLYISVTPAVRYIRKVVRSLEIAVVRKQVPTRKLCSFFYLQSMSQLVPVMFTFHTVCIKPPLHR